MPTAQIQSVKDATKSALTKAIPTKSPTAKPTPQRKSPKPTTTDSTSSAGTTEERTVYTLDLLFYVKSMFIFAMLFALAYFIGKETLYYANTADYFSYAAAKNMVVILGLVLGLLYVQAISIGCWYKNLQFIFVPLPIALGIALSFLGLATMPPPTPLSLNPYAITAFFSTYIDGYAGLIFVLAYVAVSAYVLTSMRFKNQFIKVSPLTVLRPASKGALLLFSAYAGFVVYLATSEGTQQIDPSKIISGFVDRMVDRQVDRRIENIEDAVNEGLAPLEEVGEKVEGGIDEADEKLEGINGAIKNLEDSLGLSLGEGLNLDAWSEKFDLSQLSIDAGMLGIDKEQLKQEVQDNVNRQIDSALAPYKKFLAPFAGLTAFFTFRFFLWFSYAVYLATVDVLMWFLKKVGFFRIDHEMVERELVKF